MSGFTPMKGSGFSQGIFEVGSTQKEALGTMRVLEDGRCFCYAKAGAGALTAGNMGVSAAIAANVTDEAMGAAVAVGAQTLTFTAGAAVTYIADYFKDGYLQINDAAGQGIQYEIDGSSAVTAGTAINITLKNRIQIALTTSSEATLVHSPWMAVIETTTEESNPVGTPAKAVPIANFYWAQTVGVANSLISGTPAVGTMLTLGAASGSLIAINTTLDIDQPIVARTWGTAGRDTEYCPVMLCI
ncbi:MAG: hypothetical protein JRC86_06915 [Deltaproteobacteria bacterium]|nr:hypothetical protein [Deltaproteobacteria bacterium]